jgi:hypothetical protein
MIMIMKTLTILGAALLSVAAKAQIPNASFENWTTETKENVTFRELTGWYTPNMGNAFNNEQEMATQTQDAYEGVSALKLTNIENKNRMPASAFPMSDAGAGEFIDRFPISGKITALKGFYKYDFTAAHDSCSMSIMVFRKGVNIGYGEFIGSAKVNSYSAFSATVTYFQDSIPDSASINIFTSVNDLHVGSVLTIDALTLSGSNTGTTEYTKPRVKASVYPNPVYGMAGVEFELMQAGTTSVEVYNVLGVLVHVLASNGEFAAGTHRLDWNTGHFPEGMYFVKITQDTAETTIKVLLK